MTGVSLWEVATCLPPPSLTASSPMTGHFALGHQAWCSWGVQPEQVHSLLLRPSGRRPEHLVPGAGLMTLPLRAF